MRAEPTGALLLQVKRSGEDFVQAPLVTPEHKSQGVVVVQLRHLQPGMLPQAAGQQQAAAMGMGVPGVRTRVSELRLLLLAGRAVMRMAAAVQTDHSAGCPSSTRCAALRSRTPCSRGPTTTASRSRP